MGIDDTVLKWFESYLSNRRQQVVIKGETSDTKSINAGVPQGSILGPMLFFLFTLMILLIILFAILNCLQMTLHYTWLLMMNKKLPSSLIKISIESIHQWSQKWLIKFNPDKTEIMTISKKHHKPHHPPVYMDNVIIKEFETHKHLGLTISEDGNWNEHVKNIMIKVASRLSVFRRVKFKLKRSHLQAIYI